MNAKMKKLMEDGVIEANRTIPIPIRHFTSFTYKSGFEARDRIAQEREAKLIKALEKYANPETHSMDKDGFIWCGDYFDYETAREALAAHKAEEE